MYRITIKQVGYEKKVISVTTDDELRQVIDTALAHDYKLLLVEKDNSYSFADFIKDFIPKDLVFGKTDKKSNKV